MTFVKKNIGTLMLLLCVIVVVKFGVTVGTIFVCMLMIGIQLGVELYKKSKLNKSTYWRVYWNIYRFILTVSVLIIGISVGLITSEINASVNDYESVDYAVVLGAGLNGDQVSKRLQLRLDEAVNELANNSVPIIVSGGQGPDEWISEAEAMKRYLLVKGITEDRIVIEDQSTSTRENIQYSNTLMTENKDLSVVIFTSDYHMYRAKMLGDTIGWQTQGQSAKNPVFARINYMVRECLALLKDLVLTKS